MKLSNMLLAACMMLFAGAIVAGCHPDCKVANCCKERPCVKCACKVTVCDEEPVIACTKSCQQVCVPKTVCKPVCKETIETKTITVEVPVKKVEQECHTENVCQTVCVENQSVGVKQVNRCKQGEPVGKTPVCAAGKTEAPVVGEEENMPANAPVHKEKKAHSKKNGKKPAMVKKEEMPAPEMPKPAAK